MRLIRRAGLTLLFLAAAGTFAWAQRQERVQQVQVGGIVARVDPRVEACRTASADASATLGPNTGSAYVMSTLANHYWERQGCDRYVADLSVPYNTSSNIAGEPTSVVFDVSRYSVGPTLTAQNCSTYAEHVIVYRKEPGAAAFTLLGSEVWHAAWQNNQCVTQPPATSALGATYQPPAAGTAVYRVAAGITVSSSWQAGVTTRIAHHLSNTTSTH